jgi:hypothetical protein
MAQAGATHIGNSHSSNAIPAILQYLKDSGLDATHAALQEETYAAALIAHTIRPSL